MASWDCGENGKRLFRIEKILRSGLLQQVEEATYGRLDQHLMVVSQFHPKADLDVST